MSKIYLILFLVFFSFSCTTTKSTTTITPAKITLDGSKSFDPDGDSLTYYWIQSPSNPKGLTILYPTIKITPAVVSAKGTYTVRLMVQDTWGAMSIDSLLIVAQ